jgi:hypothetical protein
MQRIVDFPDGAIRSCKDLSCIGNKGCILVNVMHFDLDDENA